MDDSLDEIFDTSLNASDSYCDIDSDSESSEKNAEEESEKPKKIVNSAKKVYTEKEINDIKRAQKQRLAAIKQTHLSEEQTLSESNDLKYRNYIWELTLNNFGRGSFTTNLRPLFEKKLIDEEYRLKKEIFELKESQKEEMRSAKAMKNETGRKVSYQRLLDPKEFAQQIFLQLQGDDSDDIYENDSMIDRILQKVRAANSPPEEPSVDSSEDFEEVFLSPPKRVKSPPKYSPEPFPAYQNVHSPPKTQKKPNKMLKRHIKERNKLKKSIEETDKFIQEMKRQALFGEFM